MEQKQRGPLYKHVLFLTISHWFIENYVHSFILYLLILLGVMATAGSNPSTYSMEWTVHHSIAVNLILYLQVFKPEYPEKLYNYFELN